MKKGPVCSCAQCYEEWASSEIERLEYLLTTSKEEHDILLERYESQKVIIRELQEKLGRGIKRERPREHSQVSL